MTNRVTPNQSFFNKSLVAPAVNCFENLKNSSPSSFKHEVLLRGAYLILAPGSVILNAVNIIKDIGIFLAGVVWGSSAPYCSTCTGRLRDVREDLSERVCLTVSIFYKNFLKILNPSAKFTNLDLHEKPKFKVNEPIQNIKDFFDSVVQNYENSEGIIRVVTKVAPLIPVAMGLVLESINGVASAVYSFFKAGEDESLNCAAYHSLLALGLIMYQPINITLSAIQYVLPPSGSPSDSDSSLPEKT